MKRADFDRAVVVRRRPLDGWPGASEEFSASLILENRQVVSAEVLCNFRRSSEMRAFVEQELIAGLRTEALGLKERVALRQDFEPLFQASTGRGDLLDLAAAFRDRLSAYVAEALP